ncbi:histidine--tRNA ligase [Candidatus Woesearchaeota archaeon]|mgnify:CR=1 FL=1|jgi:histidyl-tRNA synthetase|nr:histidine--tRNA ligase [Candidatus Woesearchaeota archaeon]MBT4114020.1 histidine--tRNA ligase [Candidatus Woesearchaeota archaeon]MBT4248373.1 histidine--tRNA ligase [Candidatus Woesearchaeota archaeon]
MKTNKSEEILTQCMSNVETPKGMQDYLPEDQIVRQELIDTIKKIFEKYGFAPIETPTLEMLSTLTAKGAGGDSVGKEIFKLTDRAGRKLGMRFDFTVPMCRFFASNQIPMPFKRYQIGNVFREEFGNRNREFIQCDVDVIGSSSLLADAEYFAIAQEFFDKIGLKIVIKVNSRKFIDKIMTAAKIPQDKRMPLILIIDKLDKLGETAVVAEARKLGVDARAVLKALKGDVPKDVAEALKYAKAMGVRDAKFVPTLARGLDYYTGLIWEIYLQSRPNKLSVASGGRFDNLVNMFCARDVPATGMSFGITRVYDALKEKQTDVRKTVTKVYVIPIETELESAEIAKHLREEGVNTDIALMDRSISKNLQYVDKMKIPYALIVGKEELKQGKVKLKDMKSGKEWLTDIDSVPKELS